MKTRMIVVRREHVPEGVGCLIPADRLAQDECREARLRVGQEYRVEIRQDRNPAFHRLAHAFGKLLADNCDEFTGMSGHAVLKRLQVEADAGCTEMLVKLEGVQVFYRIPISLAYGSMDEIQFREIVRKMASHALRRYLDWKDMDAEDLIQMAEEISNGAS